MSVSDNRCSLAFLLRFIGLPLRYSEPAYKGLSDEMQKKKRT
jgi:hypothetical protein